MNNTPAICVLEQEGISITKQVWKFAWKTMLTRTSSTFVFLCKALAAGSLKGNRGHLAIREGNTKSRVEKGTLSHSQAELRRMRACHVVSHGDVNQ